MAEYTVEPVTVLGRYRRVSITSIAARVLMLIATNIDQCPAARVHEAIGTASFGDLVVSHTIIVAVTVFLVGAVTRLPVTGIFSSYHLTLFIGCLNIVRIWQLAIRLLFPTRNAAYIYLVEKVQPRGCCVSHAVPDISNDEPITRALIKSRCASLRQVCCWLSPRLYSKQWLPETKRLYDAPNSTKAGETQYNLLELRSFGSA